MVFEAYDLLPAIPAKDPSDLEAVKQEFLRRRYIIGVPAPV
jgi:hypothetical protein